MTPDRAAETGILRHLTRWPFDHGLKRLGVSVSGGGDSMALLDLMLWHGRAHGCAIHVVTVDHGLRPEARDEAALVARICKNHETPHELLTWSWNGSGNLQAEARAARYALVAAWARRRKISTVALGHTEDDVAETFLMRLARTAGVDGLAAMDRKFTRHGITWVRPLLTQSRADLRAYLLAEGVPWAEDSSNTDPRFDRVKARGALAALAPLGLDARTLGSVAQNMAQARFALDAYAAQEADHLVHQDGGDVLIAQRSDRPVPPEISRRLLVAALQFVSGAGYPPRQEALLNMDVALHAEGAAAHTLHGCLLTLEGAKRDMLRVAREPNAVANLACATNAVWDGRWRFAGLHAPRLEVRALGDAVNLCPMWRETGLPLTSLKGTPAIWSGSDLVAAPLAGYSNGWQANLSPPRDVFARWLARR